MHCINCGKLIDGDIPVCRDCAMLVIRRQSKADVMATKIETEAKEFSLSSEDRNPPTPTYQAKVYHQKTIRPPEQNREDEELRNLLTFFGIAILFVIFLGLLGSLF